MVRFSEMQQFPDFLELFRGNSRTMGAFHSTKISEIFETGANDTEISQERSQQIRKLLNFRKANHSTQNSGNSGMKIKWNGNFQENMFENLGIPHEVIFFFFRKLCEFSIFYSALVFLAAIAQNAIVFRDIHLQCSVFQCVE